MHNLQNLQKRSKQKDYYKIIVRLLLSPIWRFTLLFSQGVERNANEREIKSKFKKLALQMHPDKIVNLPEPERTEKEKLFRDVAEVELWWLGFFPEASVPSLFSLLLAGIRGLIRRGEARQVRSR